ncbi:MAG: hypothetical protein KAS36_07510 [Anaerolineales bacterium]|nr:hypothetical protein [Anaerolineales bacterium]
MKHTIAKWYVHFFRDLEVKALNDLIFVGGMFWGALWVGILFKVFGPGFWPLCAAILVGGFLCAPVSMAYVRNLEQRILEQLEKENEPTIPTMS